MPLLTIFSAPKPFTNPHIAVIQRNALRSWLSLGQEVEVLLVGVEHGLAETAAEFGVRCLPDVARNEKGTPLVSSIFALARAASSSPLLAYLNADILVLPDFVEAARQVRAQAERFLMIGQRWDLDVTEELDFSFGWEARLRAQIRERGRLHPPAGSDYFIFPRQLFQDLPGFAIGRAGWDNWMIYEARRQGWTVVDGTPAVTIIHQNHDYSHLPGGQPHYNLAESKENEGLAGGMNNLYLVLDCERELHQGRLRTPRPSLLRSLRRAEVLLTPPNGRRQGPRWALARQFRRLRRRISGSL